MISPATVSGRSGGRPKTEIEGMDAIQRYEESTRKEEEENMTEAEKQMRDEELSFYTNSENEFGDDNIWGLLSGVGGNIYEWYVIECRSCVKVLLSAHLNSLVECESVGL